VTVADLVADVRAATPTAAGELAVPVLDDLLDALSDHSRRLGLAVGSCWDVANARVSGLLQRSVLREPFAQVHRREQVVDELSNRVHRSLSDQLRAARDRVDAFEPVIRRIAPHTHLRRVVLRLADVSHRLDRAIVRRTAAAHSACEERERRLSRVDPASALHHLRAEVARMAHALAVSHRHFCALAAERVHRQEQRLAAMGYESVLRRGFSITRMKKGRRVLRSPEGLKDGQRVVTQLADGEIESQVINLNQLELFDE